MGGRPILSSRPLLTAVLPQYPLVLLLPLCAVPLHLHDCGAGFEWTGQCLLRRRGRLCAEWATSHVRSWGKRPPYASEVAALPTCSSITSTSSSELSSSYRMQCRLQQAVDSQGIKGLVRHQADLVSGARDGGPLRRQVPLLLYSIWQTAAPTGSPCSHSPCAHSIDNLAGPPLPVWPQHTQPLALVTFGSRRCRCVCRLAGCPGGFRHCRCLRWALNVPHILLFKIQQSLLPI